MRAQHDTTATAYMPAISALRADLADLEQRAAETRALIEGLCAHAGIAGEQATPPGASAPAPPRTQGKRASAPVTEEIPSEVSTYQRNPDDQAALGKWEAALAAISAASADLASAVRDKDADKIAEAVAARARAQRHAGELLLSWNGRVAPLPGAATVHARRLCRAAAKMSAADFEEDVRRQTGAALSAIGVTPATRVFRRPASTKPDLAAAVADWEKVLAARAEAIAQAEAAARDKDPAKLKAAIATRAQHERRLGEILTNIDGRVRLLPGGTDRNARERWVHLAQLSVPKFENVLRQWQHRALTAIGVEPEKPAPKAKPTTRPQQAMKISPWTTDATGALTRTLTAEVEA